MHLETLSTRNHADGSNVYVQITAVKQKEDVISSSTLQLQWSYSGQFCTSHLSSNRY